MRGLVRVATRISRWAGRCNIIILLDEEYESMEESPLDESLLHLNNIANVGTPTYARWSVLMRHVESYDIRQKREIYSHLTSESIHRDHRQLLGVRVAPATVQRIASEVRYHVHGVLSCAHFGRAAQ